MNTFTYYLLSIKFYIKPVVLVLAILCMTFLSVKPALAVDFTLANSYPGSTRLQNYPAGIPRYLFQGYPPPDTNTPNPTNTVFTPTPTLRSGIPTQTYIVSQTGLPSQSAAAITGTITSTATLAPLPALTLVFPVIPSTQTPITAPTPAESSNIQSRTSENGIANLSVRTRTVVIVIILLWIIMAAFLVIYIRQFR